MKTTHHLPPMRVERPWTDRLRPSRSLAARIVALVLGVLAIVQLASFGAIRRSIEANVRERIDAEVIFAGKVARRLMDDEAARLAGGAAFYARDHAFQSVLGGDRPTIDSTLKSNGLPRTGATAMAVLSTDWKVEGAAEIDDGSLRLVADALSKQPRDPSQPSNVVAVIDGRPMQFVMVPILVQQRLDHWFVLGYPVGERIAALLREYSSADLIVAWAPASGDAWHVGGATVSAGLAAEAARNVPHLDRNALNTLLLDHVQYLARVTALGTDENVPGGRVAGIVTVSLDEAVKPYHGLQVLLGVITAAALAAFAIGSVFTARRVTTPIRGLVDAAERVGGGDYATPIETTHGADEIGDLARAFEKMRASIATHEEEVRRLAYWDALTGLPNRTNFAEAVRTLIAERPVKRAAVVMLDLDRFKHVNDVLGYAVGDLLLVRVAERLRAHAAGDSRAMIARLSGDEFAVLLPDADPETALRTARRIEMGFTQPILIEDQTIDLSAGIGVACWPLHANDAGALLSRAEVAMYAAKQRTTGPLLYDPANDAASAQTLSLLSELRHAVDHGELRLFLQPKIALDSGRVIGAEALVRWQHPERGMVPPGSFIPFAEQTGFVRTLTMWVLEETCRRHTDFVAAGLDLRVSVNLSTRDLVDQRLPDRIEALLAKHKAPASAFCLEITESAIMDDPERAQATLERLHRLGFKLSIDDFGTGYSSLAYLKRLPVDELKIDKSFVFGMENDPDDAKIVRSTIDLAHNLSLTVVAEGVENDAVWKMLKLLACDEGQGYHFAKPMAAEEFIGWARKRESETATPTAPAAANDTAAHA